ncbi:MAG: aconitase/3-isopropylmalate dehydratase large subunit family protein [Salinirussus sp.]
MAAQTMAQKILAAHSDVANPAPGQHVTVTPDWILAHDLSLYPGKRRMDQLGFDAVADPEQLVVVFDHHVPPKDEEIATHMNEVADWVDRQGVEHFYPSGNGISHNILIEKGYSAPGRLMLGADSHTTTHGALGAFATGIGHTDLGEVMGTGELWLKVPDSRRVVVDGSLPSGTTAKDLGLALMSELTAQGAIYESIEYHGPGIRDLAIHERQTISNLAVELGAMTGMVPPDQTTADHLDGRIIGDYEPVHPDDDAEYSAETIIDASTIEPLVAKPSRVDNIAPVREVVGTEVDQVFIGSCNNSAFADIADFAATLSGEEVHTETDLIVVPGSRATLERMNDEGVSNTILEAGGMIGTPGCGPCFGAHGGVLGEGDVCVSTMNRNFPGRMGPGEIYLASPRTAASAAVYGAIRPPGEVHP